MTENIKNYLLENMDELRGTVQELNSWNGCLDSLDVYSNDEEFFEMMFEGKPLEAVRAAHYGEYNYNDDYVRFNGYGNLVSFSEYTYEQEMKEAVEEVIEELIENHQNIYVSDELAALLNEDEEEEEEEEA